MSSFTLQSGPSSSSNLLKKRDNVVAMNVVLRFPLLFLPLGIARKVGSCVRRNFSCSPLKFEGRPLLPDLHFIFLAFKRRVFEWTEGVGRAGEEGGGGEDGGGGEEGEGEACMDGDRFCEDTTGALDLVGV